MIAPVDEFDGGFGWLAADETIRRASHALVAGGRVWVVDPVDGEGVEERVRAAGEPAGVIQLLDRHSRACRSFAERLGVPLHVLPRAPIEGAPFQPLVVRDGRWWKERALWWPERRVLVVADALGTFGYFLAGDERLGVHPFLRLVPPRGALAGLTPDVVLCGHGAGIFDGAAQALEDALRTARRRIPRALVAMAGSRRRRTASV